MKTNVGGIDKIVRIVVGIALISWVAVFGGPGLQPIWLQQRQLLQKIVLTNTVMKKGDSNAIAFFTGCGLLPY
jgi:hypothetical protein